MAEYIEIFKNNLYTISYSLEDENVFYSYDGPTDTILRVWCECKKYGLKFGVKNYRIPWNDKGEIRDETIDNLKANLENEIIPTIISTIKKIKTDRLEWKKRCIKDYQSEIEDLKRCIENDKREIEELKKQIGELKKMG